MWKMHIYVEGFLSLLLAALGCYSVLGEISNPSHGSVSFIVLLGSALIPLGATMAFWSTKKLIVIQRSEHRARLRANPESHPDNALRKGRLSPTPDSAHNNSAWIETRQEGGSPTVN